jgi:hypothetical protein
MIIVEEMSADMQALNHYSRCNYRQFICINDFSKKGTLFDINGVEIGERQGCV